MSIGITRRRAHRVIEGVVGLFAAYISPTVSEGEHTTYRLIQYEVNRRIELMMAGSREAYTCETSAMIILVEKIPTLSPIHSRKDNTLAARCTNEWQFLRSRKLRIPLEYLLARIERPGKLTSECDSSLRLCQRTGLHQMAPGH